MNESLQYGVYSKISFSNPFSHSSWENILEGIFPTEYNPDMSFETKREMHTQLIHTLMKDTRGWMEHVPIKDLRDPELKKQYISFYSILNKGSMSTDDILNNCMATQVNIDKLPRTLDYKPDKRYTYLLTTVQKFFFYYYNRRFQVEFGNDELLPVFLPKEPIHQFWDMIQERMDKKYPPKKRKR